LLLLRQGELAEAYAAMVTRLWSGRERSVAPVELKRVIGRHYQAFLGFEQHDTQELLAFLLDGLHEDLNRVLKKPVVSAIEVW
jgi:ubiquitin carboxyl-terminal hydrolase 4/11/15